MSTASRTASTELRVYLGISATYGVNARGTRSSSNDAHGVAVGHPGDVVGDALRERGARRPAAVGQQLGVVGEVVEERRDDALGLLVLPARASR